MSHADLNLVAAWLALGWLVLLLVAAALHSRYRRLHNAAVSSESRDRKTHLVWRGAEQHSPAFDWWIQQGGGRFPWEVWISDAHDSNHATREIARQHIRRRKREDASWS